MSTTDTARAAQRNKAAMTRRRTSAIKELRLVIDVATQHLGLLESNPPQVPESTFIGRAVKYEGLLGEMQLLAMLAEGAELPGDDADDGLVRVGRDDLLPLLQAIRSMFPVTDGSQPLDRLEAAAGVKPDQQAVPAAVPAPAPADTAVKPPAQEPAVPEAAAEPAPEADGLHCPTCGSPDPDLHPSTGDGGEVSSLCPDPFHSPVPETVQAAYAKPVQPS
jgi:hypothetical protein